MCCAIWYVCSVFQPFILLYCAAAGAASHGNQTYGESSTTACGSTSAGFAANASSQATLAANDCDGGDDIHVHGCGRYDGRDSIVICEGSDCKDGLFDDLLEQSVLDTTADDGDVRA